MIDALKKSLWKQFGAAIDMLNNAIMLCPDDYWNTNRKLFYQSYHCLLFLDYYLSIPPRGFSSPLPFMITTPGEIPTDAIDDLVPERMYSKIELLNYLQLSRAKCRTLIAGLTEEKIIERWTKEADAIAGSSTLNYSVLDILLYNMKHVQHHAAQLNLLLRQGINNAAGWIPQADDEL
ncbi:MAG TPA: DinB family protein [Agriterribacter sp.]|nr:DinB family protein [Agriterribacter sp.]